MIESSRALYKLMILYLLRQAGLPMTLTQISAFVVPQGYMSYFRMQQALTDLADSGLAEANTENHMTSYSITEAGAENLSYLRDDLSQEFCADADRFLKDNAYEIRSEAGVTARYRYDSAEGYVVECAVTEHEVPVIRLSLSVPTETAAQSICTRWKRCHAEVYRNLMQTLCS